jgi:hypothetical protein
MCDGENEAERADQQDRGEQPVTGLGGRLPDVAGGELP